jgi:hypothetical protein
MFSTSGKSRTCKKFVINLFKYIEKDFRKNYPGNQQTLGFHHWWTDSAGKMLYGVTNDIDLYIYLCNQNRYLTQIDKVKLKPDPPKRLPLQQTVVIQFVPKELHKEEIQDELKELFPSLFTIDKMMGTMRSSSRHIRGEFYRTEDYNKIINDGKIGLQGQIFEVEEYSPPPKILICSKCNTPGHMKRTCQEKMKFAVDVDNAEMMVINMVNVLLNVTTVVVNICLPIINVQRLLNFGKNFLPN